MDNTSQPQDYLIPHLSQKSSKTAIQHLSNASKKISKINILVIEKLNNIVLEHGSSIDKLQHCYQQIQALTTCNKNLVEVLKLFEEQEQKLLNRLRRMEQTNIQYMKQYCYVKGRQFNIPQTSEFTSIFSKVNFQDFVFDCPPQADRPAINSSYKNQLISIIKNCFLTPQEELKAKIETHLLNEKSQNCKQDLLLIKTMIQQYNTYLDTWKNQQNKFFDLLKLRSEIRKKVQEFYDKDFQTQIKPNYMEQQVLINKIINLHSKFQDSSQDAILEYLKQQKQQRSNLQTKRAKIQSQIVDRYKQLQMQNDENIKQLIKTEKIKTQLETQLNKLIADYNTEIEVYKKQIEIKNTKLTKFQEQMQIYLYQRQKNKKQIQQLIISNAALKKQLQNSGIKIQNNNQQNQLYQKLKQFQQTIHQLQKQKKEQQQTITTLKKNILIQQSQKQIIEDLAIQTYQSICLSTCLDINEKIKSKLNTIGNQLQNYISMYQNHVQWNIVKEAPDFFKNLSQYNNFSRKNKMLSDDEQKKYKRMYSTDQQNVIIIEDIQTKIKKQKFQPSQQPIPIIPLPPSQTFCIIFNNSMSIQKVMELRINGLKKEQSLDDISQNKDDYDELYKLYQQSIKCLEMEEKKSKNMELEYQKYVDIIQRKQKEDPFKQSLEKQLVYLTKLTLDQKQTIETERKQYNEIFKDFQQQFKKKVAEELRSLKQASFDSKNSNKQPSVELLHRSEFI